MSSSAKRLRNAASLVPLPNVSADRTSEQNSSNCVAAPAVEPTPPPLVLEATRSNVLLLEDLKEVLRELLRIGCHSPWPHTVAELASTRHGTSDDYVYKTACLSREDFLSVVRENLNEREHPFR